MSQISVTIVTVISTNEEKMDNFSDNLKPYFPMMNGDYGNSQINIRARYKVRIFSKMEEDNFMVCDN